MKKMMGKEGNSRLFGGIARMNNHPEITAHIPRQTGDDKHILALQRDGQRLIRREEFSARTGFKHGCAGSITLLATIVMCFQVFPASAQEVSREPFSAQELRAGKSASQEGCAAEPNAVWVEHAYGKECIRYYPSSGLDVVANTPKVAVFYFHGDHLGPPGSRYVGNYEKISPHSLTQAMQANFRKHGVPFIQIARPGVFGSTGDHNQRRRPKEFYSLNAAVDAIKQRYGLEQIVLAGQSGGSTAGAALLTLGRRDVVCAVLGAGNYDILELAEIRRKKAGQASRRGCDITNYCDPYNVADHVSGIAPDPNRAIAIVGDPQDDNTVFPLQQKFADAIRAAGHTVEVIEAEGKGADRHSISPVTYQLAGECAARFAAGKPVPAFAALMNAKPEGSE